MLRKMTKNPPVKEENKTSANRCHWGNKFVFQWQNLRFYGAGNFRGLSFAGMDVFIDCGANILQDSALRATNRGLSPAGEDRIIKINWSDGDVPDMAEKDWRGLIEGLKQLRQRLGKENLNVLVCCLGGHGRTGTALSILAALTGIASKKPVTFIRKEYCNNAVETASQCNYIREMAKTVIEDDLSAPSPELDETCESAL